MIIICFYKEKDNQMNILWVEDIPDNKQNFWFGNRRNVETVRDFSKAKEIIQTKLNNYDVVILDIDLQASSKTDDVKALAQVFSLSDHDFLKKSGMHLCLNLLESGFPREQIVFLTANADRPNRLGQLIEILKSDDVDKAKKATEEIFKTLADDQREELKKFDSKKAKLEYLTKLIPEKSIENLYDNFCEAYKAACLIPPNAISKSIENEAQRELSDWLEAHERNEYLVLRRGIIEGCGFLKEHINDDNFIRFSSFVKGTKERKPVIEISSDDIKNYLDTVEQFLPVREPKVFNDTYRLFLRTLVHEWEESIDPQETTEKYGGEIHTYAGLSKQTRNWVSHAKLLEPLNSEIIAFLFLANMRAMFKLPRAIQPYEKILLSCFSLSLVDEINMSELEDNLKDTEQNISGILTGLRIEDSGHFGKKINYIHCQNTGNPDAEPLNYKQFLLQYFWVNQKRDLRNLTAPSDDFLPTLARHIYKYSFA